MSDTVRVFVHVHNVRTHMRACERSHAHNKIHKSHTGASSISGYLSVTVSVLPPSHPSLPPFLPPSLCALALRSCAQCTCAYCFYATVLCYCIRTNGCRPIISELQIRTYVTARSDATHAPERASARWFKRACRSKVCSSRAGGADRGGGAACREGRAASGVGASARA